LRIRHLNAAKSWPEYRNGRKALIWASMAGASTWLKWSSGVGCAVLVVLSFGWYGMIQADQTYSVDRVIEASQWMLIITVIAG
jgi:hypothetical protein